MLNPSDSFQYVCTDSSETKEYFHNPSSDIPIPVYGIKACETQNHPISCLSNDSQYNTEARTPHDIQVCEDPYSPNFCPSNDSQYNTEARTPHDIQVCEDPYSPNFCLSNDSQYNAEASAKFTCDKSSTAREGGIGKPDKQRWSELNSEFSEINKDSWEEFSHGKSKPEQFA